MSDQDTRLKAFLLGKLQRAEKQTLPRSGYTVPKKIQQALGVDEAQVEQARNQLVQEGFLQEEAKGRTKRYRLTDAGKAHLQTLEPYPPVPPPPQLDEHLFPYQKAFVLLRFLGKEERKLKRSLVNSKLDTMDAKARLGFGRLSGGSADSGKVELDKDLVGWVLDRLVQEKALSVRRVGAGAEYELTDLGEQTLGGAEQYPGIKFSLTGQELNDLIEMARRAGFKEEQAGQTRPVREETSTTAPTPPEHTAHSLTPEEVLGEFEALRREKYSRDGIVPLYELRRSIADRFGPQAAQHGVLDPLLKQMRRERRVRLVSIGDFSQATPEQLNDSVPGENETFFYIEIVHEPSHVG